MAWHSKVSKRFPHLPQLQNVPANGGLWQIGQANSGRFGALARRDNSRA
jgi:hypothetical protein